MDPPSDSAGLFLPVFLSCKWPWRWDRHKYGKSGLGLFSTPAFCCCHFIHPELTKAQPRLSLSGHRNKLPSPDETMWVERGKHCLNKSTSFFPRHFSFFYSSQAQAYWGWIKETAEKGWTECGKILIQSLGSKFPVSAARPRHQT